MWRRAHRADDWTPRTRTLSTSSVFNPQGWVFATTFAQQATEQRTNGPFVTVRSLFCSLIRRGECDECVRQSFVFDKYDRTLVGTMMSAQLMTVPVVLVLWDAPCKTRTGRARRDRHVPDKGTDVRAWVPAFQNTKRTETIPKPDTTAIVLRWRVGVRVFMARCFDGTRA